eukprot:scaffold7773_cov110-Isochrysis_galbana.AAC.1
MEYDGHPRCTRVCALPLPLLLLTSGVSLCSPSSASTSTCSSSSTSCCSNASAALHPKLCVSSRVSMARTTLATAGGRKAGQGAHAGVAVRWVSASRALRSPKDSTDETAGEAAGVEGVVGGVVPGVAAG